MLWPGYYVGKTQALPEPILTEIPKIKVLPETRSAAYSTANCSGEVEEFGAGDTIFWFFPHDEMHYVLKGEADLTYTLASTSHTVQKTAHVSAGEFYVVPTGARVTWKVPPAGPFKIFWITMPGVPPLARKRPQAGKRNK